MKIGLPLMTNVFIFLGKSVLVPLVLTALKSVTPAFIQKNIFWSGAALIISDEEKNDIMKVVKSLQDGGL